MKELQDVKNMDEHEDRVMFPLQKFFRLAVKSNPSVFEWLFVPQDCIRICEPAAKEILAHRDIFLSKEIFYRFKGFAYSEYESMFKMTGKTGEKRKKQILEFGYSPKNAMNVLRLLQQGIELLETGFITMPRPNAEELREIKLGKWKRYQIEDEFKRLLIKLDEAMENTKLPDKPRVEEADKLMIRILIQYGYLV